jgi:hypothetical protein
VASSRRARVLAEDEGMVEELEQEYGVLKEKVRELREYL